MLFSSCYTNSLDRPFAWDYFQWRINKYVVLLLAFTWAQCKWDWLKINNDARVHHNEGRKCNNVAHLFLYLDVSGRLTQLWLHSCHLLVSKYSFCCSLWVWWQDVKYRISPGLFYCLFCILDVRDSCWFFKHPSGHHQFIRIGNMKAYSILWRHILLFVLLFVSQS